MPAASTDTGAPFVIGYDQGNIGFPIVAIQYDQQVGPGQTRPPLGTPAPAGTACPGAPNFPASYVFVGATTLIAERKMQWVYRILPGAWSAAKETPAPDGAIVTTITRDNIGANIIPEDVLSDGVNTITSAEAIDSFLAKEIQTSRLIDGSPFTTLSYSERGDPISIATEYVNPSEALPANAYGVDIEREPGTIHQARQVTKTTPVFDWTYASHVDPETGIVGNIAKTFVSASPSNTAGIFTGPEVVNGKTFGASGDCVVVEYQDDDVVKMQALLVTVFSLRQVEAIAVPAYPVEGGYPIPPVLNSFTPYQDSGVQTTSDTGTGSGSNWYYKNGVEFSASVGLGFDHYPDKLIGSRQPKYFIGAPNLTSLGITPTQLFATSGNIACLKTRLEGDASAWANDTASGNSSSSSTSAGYELQSFPACLNGSTNPGNFNGGSFFGKGYVNKAGTTPWPPTSGTIVEFECELMKFNMLFRLEIITWTVPTPP